MWHGLPLGWILPCCVRLTGALEKTVDGVTEGEVRSETCPKGLCIDKTMVLPLSCGVGHSTNTLNTFSGSEEQSLHPSRMPKRPQWQSRRIIPGRF